MKSIVLFLALLALTIVTNAQSRLTKENIRIDSVIKAEIIDPAVKGANGTTPDWDALTKDITKKYDATYADRTVTKAIIYFSYYKDWPAFTAAIVKYTTRYEDPENLKLMNTNAKYILQHSDNQAELKAALGWIQHAVDKEPSNTDYQQTVAGLKAKIK